ncbi:DUF4114 domain-containing protein [Leptothoe spongobia]|uniref:DUF4114 domain-containing protein n=1 Tax=Leptothoe spongobia TAU-MAC 1115 TaxID=1967444 RepID=A0A947DBH6_9CYAN|nr:DUF4114 domain-containing protein [Leptothoe spongobia]MBT9314190.1 DUF4114 domain-containing protein [Leptothoe spongobia TAU-MAC 1115]
MRPNLLRIVARQTQSVTDGSDRRLVFRVIFDEEIQKIDKDDFVVTGSSTAEITSVAPAANGNPLAFDITVDNGDLDTFSGEVGVDLAENPTITSLANDRPLAIPPKDLRRDTFTLGDTTSPETPVPTGNSPTIDRIITREDLSELEGSDPRLVFRAIFNEDVKDLDTGDFIVTGGATAVITDVFSISDDNSTIFQIIVKNGDLGTFSGDVGLTLAENVTINSVDDNTPLAALGDNIPLGTFTLENGSTGGDDSGNNSGNDSGNDSGSGNPGLPTSGGSESLLSAITETNVVDITQLGASEALSLTVEISQILTVGSLKVFSTDANGGNRTQIGAFSVIENSDNVLPDFTPKFNLLRSSLSSVTHLQFELEENGVVSIGSPKAVGDGTLSLIFDNGTQLNAALEDTAPAPGLLQNDAATIDLTNLTGQITISGSIHREASFNNVVDLYETDADGAVFDAMGNKFMPGEEGYQEAAIANRLNINLTGTNGQVNSFRATLTGDTHLGIFVAVDGVDPTLANDDQIFFSHSGANGNVDHFRSLGDNTFGIEDQVNLGDSDFDDVIVSFNIL